MKRGILIVCALSAGCSVKPLVVLDASARDGSADEFSPDAVVDDVAATADGALDDGFVFDGAARMSCPPSVMGRECSPVAIEAPTTSFCLGVATSPGPLVDVSPTLCGATISAFAIDRSEVSVRRFSVFFNAWQRGQLPAQLMVTYPSGLSVAAARPDLASPTYLDATSPLCAWNGPASSARDLHPMNCLSFETAQYFCAWDGGRLPTRAEFEYVARYWRSGVPMGRLTPWGGMQVDCNQAQLNFCAGANGLPTRHVSDGNNGAAGGEVLNLVGNVAEWVIDRFDSYATLGSEPCWRNGQLCASSTGTSHELRGGSYASPTIFSRAVSREQSDGAPSPERGFRCVYRSI